jgi:hypothetical protein
VPAPADTLSPTNISLAPSTEVYSSAADVVRKKSGRDILRLAAIGLIFQTEDNLRDRAAKGKQIIRSTQNVMSSLSEPFRGSMYAPPGPNPIQKRFNRLVRRGELELASWIRTGEEQERESRQLAELAWRDTTEDSIDFLASNPSVQELVQTQSTGLAAEVIEEVRERTVSADTFLEGIARNILRKTPRAILPAPPPEVKEHAASLRPQPAKSKSKQKSAP